MFYNERQYDQIHFLHSLCVLLNNQQNAAIMFFSYVIYYILIYIFLI